MFRNLYLPLLSSLLKACINKLACRRSIVLFGAHELNCENENGSAVGLTSFEGRDGK